MPEIKLLLNRQFHDYEKMVGDIRKNLEALDTVETREQSEPALPGTLAVEWAAVTGFVISHADKLIDVVKALIETTGVIIATRAATKTSAKEKPMVIVVGESELALPASEEKRKQFLSEISGGKRSKPNEKKKQPKKQTGEKARPRK